MPLNLDYMKNLSVSINVILAISVGVLYYLHFSNKSSGAIAPSNAAQAESKLAFVNIDTLLSKYTYYQQIKDSFTTKQRNFEEDITKRGKSLESEYMAVQEKARAGQMTEMQMKETEQSMMKKQQDLMAYKQEMEDKLVEEQKSLNDLLYKKVAEHLKAMNAANAYHFIFGYTKEGGILLASDSLDLTGEVLKRLNAEN